MRRRGLVGVLIALALAGCGSGSHGSRGQPAGGSRSFDAKASYACLLKRPEYQPSMPAATQNIGFTLLGRQPLRNPKYLPGDSTRLGAGSGFGVFFSGTSIPGGGLMLTDLKFFDNVGAARAWHKHLVLRADPVFRSLARKAVQLDRNLVINWGNGAEAAPKRLNAIVQGCLRTRATPTTQSQSVSISSDQSTIVLQAVGGSGAVDEAAMQQAAKILRSRLQRLGHPASQVQVEGSRIVLNFAGSPPPAQVEATAANPGLLEFYDLETSLTGPSLSPSGNPVQATDLYVLLSKLKAEARAAPPASFYLFTSRHGHFFGPAPTKSAALALAKKSHAPKGWTFLAVPHNTAVLTCESIEVVCPGNLPQQGNAILPPPKGKSYYYLFTHDPNATKVGKVKGVPQLTGSDLKRSGTRQDFDPTTNEPVVLMQFTGSGSHKFQEVTSEEYKRGHNRNGLPQHFSIVLDREIRSFPQIDPTNSDLAGGISGNAEISGIGSRQEARRLAVVLQTGALPVRFIRVR